MTLKILSRPIIFKIMINTVISRTVLRFAQICSDLLDPTLQQLLLYTITMILKILNIIYSIPPTQTINKLSSVLYTSLLAPLKPY